MDQQGQTEGYIRHEALEALAVLSIYEPSFLHALRDNLASTLWRYGFALSPEEFEEASNYLTANADLSDAQIIERLQTLEKRW